LGRGRCPRSWGEACSVETQRREERRGRPQGTRSTLRPPWQGAWATMAGDRRRRATIVTRMQQCFTYLRGTMGALPVFPEHAACGARCVGVGGAVSGRLTRDDATHTWVEARDGLATLLSTRRECLISPRYRATCAESVVRAGAPKYMAHYTARRAGAMASSQALMQLRFRDRMHRVCSAIVADRGSACRSTRTAKAG
jgi:hypothetical protein